MRKLAAIGLFLSLLSLSGCTAGDLVDSIFGAKNSNDANLNHVNANNRVVPL
jgi:hypothetical protein